MDDWKKKKKNKTKQKKNKNNTNGKTTMVIMVVVGSGSSGFNCVSLSLLSPKFLSPLICSALGNLLF